MGFRTKFRRITLAVFGMAALALANPDWPAAQPASITTADYTINVAFKRVWNYGGTGERFDGPTLIVRGPNVNVVYAGNPDYLKLLSGTILSAKAMGLPVTFHFDQANWCYLKYLKAGPTSTGEPDWALDGNKNSYSLLRVEIK
jgi:hypothetical protein